MTVPADLTLLVPLPPAPTVALACLEAISELAPEPRHDVVLVDSSCGVLDELLARVEGEVTIVRADRRAGLAAAIEEGLERVGSPLVAILPHAALPTPGALAALHEVLSDPSVAVATAVTPGGTALAPAAAPALATRTPLLRDATLVGLLRAPDAVVLAAVCAALAPHGAVVPVGGAVVHPADGRSAAARGGWKYGAEPEVSIVIPTLDAAGDRARGCVRALQAHTDAAHEIVIVDNGAPPQGFTAPVNAGVRAARGRYVVVCNDDVEVLPGWWPPLRAALADPELGAEVVFPLTVDGAMREDFAAWCFAMRASTVERFGVAPGEFFDPTLRVWFQDTDLLVRLRAAYTPPLLVRDSRVRHGLSETVGTADPALRAWIDAQIMRDRARFAALHGDGVPGAAR
jgi:hypothetical protein